MIRVYSVYKHTSCLESFFRKMNGVVSTLVSTRMVYTPSDSRFIIVTSVT